MEPIGLSLMALGVVATGALAARRQRHRDAEEKLRRELLRTDRRLTSEYHRARREMNDAAGQSWRNLAG